MYNSGPYNTEQYGSGNPAPVPPLVISDYPFPISFLTVVRPSGNIAAASSMNPIPVPPFAYLLLEDGDILCTEAGNNFIV